MTTKKEGDMWKTTSIILGVLLLVSLLVNAVLITLLAVGGDSDTTVRTGTQTQPTQQQAPTVEVSADDDPVLGNANAKVTIIEFSDYECPFCGRFYGDAYQMIKDEYVANGDAKVVFRDFPLSFHPRALPSAIAAECVDELADDETYFAMHDMIFENQGSLDDQSLRTYAVSVGVDGSEFDECFADADGSIQDEIRADMTAGQQAGVSGTPTVFVNGQKIVGACPESTFSGAIEAELVGKDWFVNQCQITVG